MTPRLYWKWRTHRRRWRDRGEHQTSAWALWWLGWHAGWIGLCIVREHWGWRFVIGPWHICGHAPDA